MSNERAPMNRRRGGSNDHNDPNPYNDGHDDDEYGGSGDEPMSV